MSTTFLESITDPTTLVHPQVSCRTARQAGILVVDDDDFARAVLEVGLRKNGFVVWHAQSGREALEVYRRHVDQIDLVLLDVNMSGLDGLQTLAALWQIDPGVRCCFLSGEAGSYTREELLAQGALAVFHKTFRTGQIASAVRQLLDQPQDEPEAHRSMLTSPFWWLFGQRRRASETRRTYADRSLGVLRAQLLRCSLLGSGARPVRNSRPRLPLD